MPGSTKVVIREAEKDVMNILMSEADQVELRDAALEEMTKLWRLGNVKGQAVLVGFKEDAEQPQMPVVARALNRIWYFYPHSHYA